ncbi:MAG: hydrogenase-1 expression HyaE [Thiothrix sp.]
MSQLLDRLTHDLGYPLLADQASLEAFANPQENTMVFLPANPQHYPETLDVAIVLPEFLKIFQGRLSAGVADMAFAKELAAKYAITEWPTLLFLRHGEYLGTIPRMRNWDVYLSKINAFLSSSSPAKAPGIGVPVVGAPLAAGCH